MIPDEPPHDEYIATTAKWKWGGMIRRSLADAQADVEKAVAYKRYPVDDPTPIVTRDDMMIYKRSVSEWKRVQ